MRRVLELLPISALSGGLRAVLRSGDPVPLHDWVTLLVWGAVAGAAAAPLVPLGIAANRSPRCVVYTS